MQQEQNIIWHTLIAAIKTNDGDAIRAMYSANVLKPLLVQSDPTDELARTPLMLAYWWGKAIAASALVNAGSDYSQNDSRGENASWYARRFGNGERVELMDSIIDAGERRLSMEKVISNSQSNEEPTAPPKRRQSEL